MIYFIQEKGLFRNRIKIGYTDNIRQRLGQIQSHSPSRLKLVLALPGDEQDEFVHHKKFAAYRLHGEWFKLGLRLRLFVWLNQFTVFASPVSSDKPLPEPTSETETTLDFDPDRSPPIPTPREKIIIDLYQSGASMKQISEQVNEGRYGGWYYDKIREVLEKFQDLPTPSPKEQVVIDMWENGASFNEISKAINGGRWGGTYNGEIKSTLAKFGKLPQYDSVRAEQIRQMLEQGRTKTDIAQYFGYKQNAGAIYYEIEAALTPSLDEQKIIDAYMESTTEDGKLIMSHVTQKLRWTATGPNYARIKTILSKWGVSIDKTDLNESAIIANKSEGVDA